MADKTTFKNVALARVKSAKILIDNQDWQGATYLMGLALECALKATICKTLRIAKYPESHHDKKIPDFFMTHSFERLLLLSGLSDIFNVEKIDDGVYDSWSAFTVQYPGEWTAMRYADPQVSRLNKPITKQLFACLYENEKSIINIITLQNRW